ncbi:MAG: MFS transporter [Candidatus Peribacter sp.]|nr:MFS transporter [Candidatus Peribacter sp.]
MTKPKHPRTVLWTLFFTIFLDLLGMGLAIPILALLLISPSGILPPGMSLETRTILYGFLVATYPLAQFFGAPIFGALSDRYGRRRIIMIALCGTLLGYLLTGYGIVTGQVWLIFLSRALDGFTGGNISAAQSAIADVSEPKEKARNFGLIGMAFGLGFILGPFMGGKLADPTVLPWFTSSTPFWAAAILAGLNILLVVRFLPETLHTRTSTRISLFTGFRNIRRAFQFPHLRTILFVSFLLVLGFNFFTQFFQVMLIERFNFTQSDIGNLYAYMGLWIAITQGLINRPLSRRFSSEQIVSVSAFTLAASLPFLLLPERVAFIYLVFPFIAVSNGLTHPNATAIVSNLAGPESQGEVLGINQSLQALAMALPPIIAGVIATLHPGLPTIVGSGLIFLAWMLFVFVFRKRSTQVFHEV